MKTAIYLKKTRENTSLEDQRKLLLSYLEARKNLEGPVREYKDEDIQGEGPSLPGFAALIEGAKRGEFQALLIEELPCLGRDYQRVGDYLEKIFPMLHIRVLSVKDRYDSEKQKKKSSEKNLALQMYGRSLSKKKQERKQKKEKEPSFSGLAPFGYVKEKEQREVWKVDPEAAQIIRKIFELAAGGWTTSQISHFLNDNQVPTPLVYNRIHNNWGERSTVTAKGEELWTSSSVAFYLKKREYTGVSIIGKKKSLGAAPGTLRLQPMQEQEVTEGTHEAIVSQELFREAQSAIRTREKSPFIRERDYFLKGKLRCGTCRRCMSYGDGGGRGVFFCSAPVSSGVSSRCSQARYREEVLKERILLRLKEHITEETSKGNLTAMDEMKKVREQEVSWEELAQSWIRNVYVTDERQIEIEFFGTEE